MSRLSSCMKKAGKALSKADVDNLTKVTNQYMEEGDTHVVAATKAVEDLVRSSQKIVEGYEKEITDKGGDVQAADFNLDDEISFAKGTLKLKGVESKLDKMIAKKTRKPIKVKRDMTEDEVFVEFMDKEGFTEDEAAVIKKGGFGTQSIGEKVKKRVLKVNKNAKTRFRQAVVDQYASFKELMGDDRSWMLAHLTSSAPGAIEATMHHGQPKLDKSGVITVDTKK